eukprot:3786984-Rhodomonas_salina.1
MEGAEGGREKQREGGREGGRGRGGRRTRRAPSCCDRLIASSAAPSSPACPSHTRPHHPPSPCMRLASTAHIS